MAEPNREWVYYHALYHLVAYWGAFMAAAGLLASLGVVVSTAGNWNGLRRVYCQVAIATTLAGSWLFLWRMLIYGALVNGMLPPAYVSQLSLARASPAIVGTAVMATNVLAGLASAILWWPAHGRGANPEPPGSQ